MEFVFLDEGVFVDPDTLTGEVLVYDSGAQAYISQTTPVTFVPNQLSIGVYDTTWVASETGDFKISLLGEFDDPGPDDILHEKYFLIGEVSPPLTLDSSYLICFLGALDPVYVDPELILGYYPAGDYVEITEIIHRKSIELEDKLGVTSISNLTTIQHDFVVAATMCELSRIYGLNDGGLTGFVGAASFKLGDLEVDKGNDGGRMASGSYDMGNAGSWCELASVLKAQLFDAEGSMRPVVPGAIYDSPIPSREFVSYDH